MKDRSRTRAAVSRSFRHVLAMLLLAGTAVAGDASATTYRVVVLPVPEGASGRAVDINTAGEVAGVVYLRNRRGYAVTWSPPDYAMRILPSGDGSQTFVLRISDGGDVIGTVNFQNASRVSVMWKSDGSFVRMATRGGDPSMTDINAQGIVVGGNDGPDGIDRPIVWTTPQAFRTLVTPSYRSASAVNDSGVIVGGPVAVTQVPHHAFRWTLNDGYKDIGDLPGGLDSSAANDINNSGQVLGVGNSDLGQRAVVWDADGSMHDLGDLPGSTAYYPFRINNLGDVIGQTTNGVQWLWTASTGMMPIDSLIDPDDPLYGAGFFGLHGINDAGVLAAELDVSGEPSLAILLVPQP